MRFIFRCILFLACLLGTVRVVGQDNPLALPSSPAFSILNFEPASVMRPGNVKDLTSDILNSFDKDGKLLLNIGIEVAPYWLKSRPFLDRKTYLEAKGMQSLRQTLLLSAATVKDTVTGGNKLGAGFRFKLYNGQVSKDYQGKENQLTARQTITGAINVARTFINDTVTRDDLILFIQETIVEPEFGGTSVDAREIALIANRYKGQFEDVPEDLNIFIDTLANVYDRTYDGLKKEVAALARQRYGFILEFAGATSFNSTDNDFEKAGIWFTAANVISASDSYNVTGRYFFSTGDSSMTNADLGISYVKQLNRFSIAIEGMARAFRAETPAMDNNNQPITKVDRDFTYRLAVQSAYKLSDDISINISLGKGFDTPFISGDSYFSIFGINYSIFKPLQQEE